MVQSQNIVPISIPGNWSDSVCHAMSNKAIRDANSDIYRLFHYGTESSLDTNKIILSGYNVELEDKGDIITDEDYYIKSCYQKIMDSLIRKKFPLEILNSAQGLHQNVFNDDRIHFKDEFFLLTDSATREVNKKLFINMLKEAGLTTRSGYTMIYLCKSGKVKVMIMKGRSNEELEIVKERLSRMTFHPWIIGNDTLNSIMSVPRE